MGSDQSTKNAHVYVRIRNDRVTGSSLELTVNDDGVKGDFAIDKGLFMGNDEQDRNFVPENFDHFKALFLTHAHVDHCGQIPHMCKNGFDSPIYMSRQTAHVSQALIQDEFYVLKQNGTAITKEDDRAYRKMINQTRIVRSYENVNFDNAVFTFVENAHVLGSNMVYMRTKNSITNMHMLVTGDYRPTHPFLKTRGIRQFIKNNPIDVMFMEATYGEKENHPQFDDALQKLKDSIMEVINGGGDALIPVFSFDRTQVILYALKQLQTAFPEFAQIPIYLDGKLSQFITNIYLQEATMSNGMDPASIIPANLQYVVGKQERKDTFEKRRKIVLATSGQMHSGAIVPHMFDMIENPNDGLICVGYVGHKTGKSILEAELGSTIKYNGREVKVNFKRYVISGFSAHADKSQLGKLVKLVRKYNPKLKVVLYHGDADAKVTLRQYLADEEIIPYGDVYIPQSTQRVCINKYTLSAGKLLEELEN